MVSDCLEVSVFCICSAVLAVLLKQYSHEQSLMVSLLACTGVLMGFMIFMNPLVSEIREIFTQAGISESYISLVFKASAVCFVTRITCEVCRDSGENAIASAAEIWGRGAVTFMSIPLARALLEKVSGML